MPQEIVCWTAFFDECWRRYEYTSPIVLISRQRGKFRHPQKT